LSPDGKFVAFTVNVPNADGQFVLKNVATGGETKVAVGSRGTPTGGPGGGTPGGESEAEDDDQQPAPLPGPGAVTTPRGPTGNPTFTPDSKFVYFPLLPTKAEMDKARADKKKPEEFPKGVLAVMDVSTGQIVKRMERVRSFSIVGEGAGVLVATMEAVAPLSPPVSPTRERGSGGVRGEGESGQPAPLTPNPSPARGEGSLTPPG
jgi:hypothetical protein